MEKSQLFELLEMDSPADFGYFEQFADLMENEEDIDFDLFYEVLSAADSKDLGEIAENYFGELSAHIPDDADDIFSVIDTVKDRLLLLTEGMDQNSKDRYSFADELYRFRDWLQDPTGASVDGDDTSVIEAITEYREEQLTGKSKQYDFSKSANYRPDEMSISLGQYNRIDTVDPETEEEK